MVIFHDAGRNLAFWRWEGNFTLEKWDNQNEIGSGSWHVSSKTFGPLSCSLSVWVAWMLIPVAVVLATESRYSFRILVVDDQTDLPVPMVELRTVSGLVWITDNAGVACIDAPELQNRETWFYVQSHGYEYPADGFGFRGVRIIPKQGDSRILRLKRTMIAERMGRLTGSGLVAESQKLGEHLDVSETGVVGCDSVRTASWNGGAFWIWGDTNVPKYPLGLFHTLGATTGETPFGSIDVPIKPQWKYFRNERGEPRNLVASDWKGPIWLGGLTNVDDRSGKSHLVATYQKIKGFLEAVEIGLCEWNQEKESFEILKVVWSKTPESTSPAGLNLPDGHVTRYRDENGVAWLLFGNSFPDLKLEDRYEAWQDPKSWIPIQAVTQLDDVQRNPVHVHRGAIAWSSFLQSWVSIFTEQGGKPSFLGELWYAKSETPFGPWSPAVKVVTHNNYTLYNPALHADWSSGNDPYLYFEGTYTAEFANNPQPTPRYNYNQILFRIHLQDNRLSDARSDRR